MVDFAVFDKLLSGVSATSATKSPQVEALLLASEDPEVRLGLIYSDPRPETLKKLVESETDSRVIRHLVEVVDLEGLLNLIKRGYGSSVLGGILHRPNETEPHELDEIIQAVVRQHKGQAKHILGERVNGLGVCRNPATVRLLLENSGVNGLRHLAVSAYVTGELDLLVSRLKSLNPQAKSTHDALLGIATELPRGSITSGLEKIIRRLSAPEGDESGAKRAKELKVILRWWTLASEEEGGEFEGSTYRQLARISKAGQRSYTFTPAWMTLQEEEEVSQWSEKQLQEHLKEFLANKGSSIASSRFGLHWVKSQSRISKDSIKLLLEDLAGTRDEDYLYGGLSPYARETMSALSVIIKCPEAAEVFKESPEMRGPWLEVIAEESKNDFSYAYLTSFQALVEGTVKPSRVLEEGLEAAAGDVQLFKVIAEKFEGSFGELLGVLRELKAS